MTECSEHLNKICSKCQQQKPLKFFPRKKVSKDGYHSRCKVCVNSINKELRLKSIEKYKESRRKYYQNNREKMLEEKKKYHLNHKSEKSAYDKKYRSKNKQKIKEFKRNWERLHKDNPIFKIKRNLRRRIHHVLNGNNKSDATFELIGCSPEEFKSYIESLWTENMSWENYGIYGWHIDHIIPCYKFDLTKPEEQRKCFYYTNQRPLWAKDNLSRPRDC